MRKLITVFIFISSLAHSQSYTFNPYSSRGFGELDPSFHGAFGGLGQATSVFTDSTQLNFYNSSSYSFLGKGQPIFSIGLTARSIQLYEGNVNSAKTVLGINNFSLGMSFGKRYGFAVGIRPYSSTGYESKWFASELNTKDTVYYTATGNGSVNQSFIGASAFLINKNGHTLSIGGQFNYLFGQLFNKRSNTLNDAFNGGLLLNSLKVNGVNFDAGLTYKYEVSKKHIFTFASNYTFSTRLNYEKSEVTAISTDVTDQNQYDTLTSTLSLGSFYNPSILSAGFKYDFFNINNATTTSNRVYHLQLLADVKISQWSSTFTSLPSSGLNAKDVLSFHTGAQFTPHYDVLDRSKTISFISKVKYRVGGFYASTPWLSNSANVYSNYAVTFGLGVPILAQRSLSSLNVSYVLGSRKTSNSNELKERYDAFQLGVVICPSFYDRWFKKGKID
jgi:hypothetical protein